MVLYWFWVPSETSFSIKKLEKQRFGTTRSGHEKSVQKRYDFWEAGISKSEPPCRREHDFKVLSKSRKVLHFGVVLVPPFRAFGVSYRRKHCLERCLNFLHFLHRLLCYFKPPKWPPNHVKWRSIFGTIFYRSAGVRSGSVAVPSPPGTPLSSTIPANKQRPLRFAALPVIRQVGSRPGVTRRLLQKG